MKNKRERLVFVPKFNRSISGWSVKFIRKNLWRLHCQGDFDDMFQEAYLIFLVCAKKYGGGCAKNGAHFMALYKRAFINHFTDLTKKASKDRELLISNISERDGKEVNCFDMMPGSLPNEGEMRTYIRQCPKPMQMFIAAMESGLISQTLQADAKKRGVSVKQQYLGKNRIARIIFQGDPKDLEVKRHNGIPNDAIIQMLKEGNQRRQGTKAYVRYSLYEDGMTVVEYIAAGKKSGMCTVRGNIHADMKRGNISLKIPKQRPGLTALDLLRFTKQRLRIVVGS